MNRSTGVLAPMRTIAFTPNPFSLAFETEAEPRDQAKPSLLKRADAFIDRIMTHQSTIPKRILRPRYAIRVRYPSPLEIVRTAPENQLGSPWWPTIADPATGEVYFISPRVLIRSSREIQSLCVSIGFALAVSTEGARFLWPYPADFSGTLSAEMAIEEAREHWVRITLDKAAGDYHLERHPGHNKPRWPRLEHDDVFDVVFVDRDIDSLKHPVMKRLRAEVDA